MDDQNAPYFLFIGGLPLAYFFRNRLAKVLWTYRMNSLLNLEKTISIISRSSEWHQISSNFCREAKKFGAIGFDCEWVQYGGRRRPVALLQMATHNGECALIRLCQLKKCSMQSLMNILKDESILKVGVSIDKDIEYLWTDYEIEVNGFLDLRHLFVLLNDTPSSESNNTPAMGLSALSERYLGKKMSKDWRVSASDWEDYELTEKQIDYASEDAYVGIQLLLTLTSLLMEKSIRAKDLYPSPLEKPMVESIREICSEYKGVKFVPTPVPKKSAAKKNATKKANKKKANFKKLAARLNFET